MTNPERDTQAEQTLRLVEDNSIEDPANQERERLELSGRAGTDPTFRTTPHGTLIGRFSLAVHDASDSTVWHQIAVFNELAEALEGVVKRGAAIDVVGYLHKREIPTSDGSSRTITEIYAASVRATPPKGRRSR